MIVYMQIQASEVFYPNCCLGHPENYLFLLSKKIYLGSKCTKILKLLLKKKSLLEALHEPPVVRSSFWKNCGVFCTRDRCVCLRRRIRLVTPGITYFYRKNKIDRYKVSKQCLISCLKQNIWRHNRWSQLLTLMSCAKCKGQCFFLIAEISVWSPR